MASNSPRAPAELWTASFLTEFGCRSALDEVVCQLGAVDHLPDGRIVVLDRANCFIKVFDLEYSLVGCHKVTNSYEPRDMCILNNNVLVICADSLIIFEIIDDEQMTILAEWTRVSLDISGISIATNGDEVCITGYVHPSQKKILILSVEFDEVATIDVSNLFPDSKCPIWTLSRTNTDELWVSDQFENCVYCFPKYDHSPRWIQNSVDQPRSLVEVYNSAIVAYDSGTIMQITDGVLSHTVVHTGSRLIQGMSFNRDNYTLAVSDDTGHVRTYALHNTAGAEDESGLSDAD